MSLETGFNVKVCQFNIANPCFFLSRMAEQNRVDFVCCLLDGNTIAYALKKYHLGEGTPARIKKHLQKTHSLMAKQKSGRPRTYNNKLLEGAYNLLVEDPDRHWTTETFFEHLVDCGFLEDTANKRAFMDRFKAWTKLQRLHITWHSKKNKFQLHGEGEKKKRLQFAHEVQDALKKHLISDFIFIDETSIEYGGHPKSGVCMEADERL